MRNDLGYAVNKDKPNYCQGCGNREYPLQVHALINVGPVYSYRLWLCSLECARNATKDLQEHTTIEGAENNED